MTSVVLMKRHVEDEKKKKARRSTGCISVRCGKRSNSRGSGQLGAEGRNSKDRLEVAEVNCVASFE